MRFRKIAVALSIAFMSLAARAHAASPDAIIAALQSSAAHAPRLEQLAGDHQREVTCLALNLYHEARGSTQADRLGVAWVTKNRITQGGNRKGYCDIIWEKDEYSWTVRSVAGMMPREVATWNRMVALSMAFIAGEYVHDITNGANTFYAKRLGTPTWTLPGKNRQTIGAHVYVKMPRR